MKPHHKLRLILSASACLLCISQPGLARAGDNPYRAADPYSSSQYKTPPVGGWQAVFDREQSEFHRNQDLKRRYEEQSKEQESKEYAEPEASNAVNQRDSSWSLPPQSQEMPAEAGGYYGGQPNSRPGYNDANQGFQAEGNPAYTNPGYQPNGYQPNGNQAYTNSAPNTAFTGPGFGGTNFNGPWNRPWSNGGRHKGGNMPWNW